MSDDELTRARRPARRPRHGADRQLGPAAGRFRQFHPHRQRPRRQAHPLRPDPDPLRRPQRRRRALARAGRQHPGRSSPSWRRWPPSTASPSPSRTIRISPATSWSISASRPARMSASSSIPANTFPVAEVAARFHPRRSRPHVRYLHLKDYRVQFTDEGYRLVRCAIGDGAVPFRDSSTSCASTTSRCRRRSRSARSRRGMCGCSPRTGGTAIAPKDALGACRLPARGAHATTCPTTPITARRGKSSEDGDALIDFELEQVRKSAREHQGSGTDVGDNRDGTMHSKARSPSSPARAVASAASWPSDSPQMGADVVVHDLAWDETGQIRRGAAISARWSRRSRRSACARIGVTGNIGDRAAVAADEGARSRASSARSRSWSIAPAAISAPRAASRCPTTCSASPTRTSSR